VFLLFTIAKTWKQLKCPLTDKWIKKMWCIYTVEYYSAIKRTKWCHLQKHGWMELEVLIQSEISQKEKDSIWYHLYLESNIRDRWTCLLNRNILTGIENRFVVAKGLGGERGMDWEFGVSRCKLWHLEWISNEVLPCSTRNCIQSLGIERDGRYMRKRIYIYETGSLCCTAEIDRTL